MTNGMEASLLSWLNALPWPPCGFFWKPGNPDFWKSGNPDFWDLEIQKLGVQQIKKNEKFSKFESVLPKMLARSGLVGKKNPGPIWGHLRPFFPWTEKMQKMLRFCLFSLVGQWADSSHLPTQQHKLFSMPIAVTVSKKSSIRCTSIPTKGG